MCAAIFQRAGITLVHNQAGANMAGGVASALLDAARARNRIAGELGLFEVDELWLDVLASQLHPRAILLGNLFRDQLDRYGELEAIAERWAQIHGEEGTQVEARQPWQVGVVAGVRLDFEPSVGHSLQLGCAHVAVNAVVEAGQGEEDRRNRHVREHRQSIQVLTEQAVVKRKDDAAAG